MIKIRRGVFETNSSSSHSISITPGLPPAGVELTPDEIQMLNKLEGGRGLLDYSLVPDDDGVLRIKGVETEFGWEIQTYADAGTKAIYCYIDQYGKQDKIQMLEEVLMEQTLATDVRFYYNPGAEYGEPGNGYIDHQSQGTSDAAFASKDALRNFIFNKHSFLKTDHDNH